MNSIFSSKQFQWAVIKPRILLSLSFHDWHFMLVCKVSFEQTFVDADDQSNEIGFRYFYNIPTI